MFSRTGGTFSTCPRYATEKLSNISNMDTQTTTRHGFDPFCHGTDLEGPVDSGSLGSCECEGSSRDAFAKVKKSPSFDVLRVHELVENHADEVSRFGRESDTRNSCHPVTKFCSRNRSIDNVCVIRPSDKL